MQCLKNIQLFRERLSFKRGKAYVTMSKVIMGSGGFYGCLSEHQGVSAWWKETAQTRLHFLLFLVAESPWSSIKQSQTLTTHNTNRHCRVRFYTFVGQPLSKQLYIIIIDVSFNFSFNCTFSGSLVNFISWNKAIPIIWRPAITFRCLPGWSIATSSS